MAMRRRSSAERRKRCASNSVFIFNWLIWPDFSSIPDRGNPFLRFHEIHVGESVALEGGREITALPALHTVPAVAYRLACANGSLVFSGDTTYSEPLIDAINDHDHARESQRSQQQLAQTLGIIGEPLLGLEPDIDFLVEVDRGELSCPGIGVLGRQGGGRAHERRSQGEGKEAAQHHARSFHPTATAGLVGRAAAGMPFGGGPVSHRHATFAIGCSCWTSCAVKMLATSMITMNPPSLRTTPVM